MGYIKSHSNYVIKEKHQLTNDGTIFERDMATVGGLNKFASGQVPIYQSSNFIITINNELTQTKDYSNDEWEKNASSETWTLNNINNYSRTNDSIDTNKIILKKDYYNLMDFAYYGSCSELIRSSITDIINNFPGELYVPYFTVNKKNHNNSISEITDGIKITYGNNNTVLGSNETDESGLKYVYLVDNPFNINIHTEYIDEKETENKLKFFANNLYRNFNVIDTNGNAKNINSVSITSSTSTCSNIGDCISTVNITYNNNKHFIIKAFLYSQNNIVYLTTKNNFGLHIRPKSEFLNDFFNKLDSFQKVLLNRNSTPKYTATFEVIEENSFGYESSLKSFTFPTTYGDYNLSTNDRIFSSYLSELINVSSFYDETFCDNLYRNMTHESIKNFDWTYTKEFSDGEEDEYVIGGTKVQKVLRLIGREFDEIKVYVDNISNTAITYDDKNNLADYFFTDTLNNEGWEIYNIYPLGYTYNNANKKYSVSSDTTSNVSPYSKTKLIKYGNTTLDGYVNNCSNGTPSYSIITGNSTVDYNIESNTIQDYIFHYSNEKEYSMQEVNNHFLKMLILNSRNIFRHKGTTECIEILLGLFGLKSKKYVNSIKDNDRIKLMYNNQSVINNYDYEVIEYTTFARPINDSDNSIDNYNRKKTIIYNTKDYAKGIYNKYQGLPVRCSVNGYIYPYFSPNKIIDGNPYYQMNGGWLNKPSIHNNFVSSTFTETIKNVKSVNNINDLLKIPYATLNDGDIYYVKNLNDEKIIINGVVYDVHEEHSITQTFKYIKFEVVNHSINVGNMFFYDKIIVSHKNSTSGYVYDLNALNNGKEIKVYLRNNSITVSNVDNSSYSISGSILTMDATKTNYFKIKDRNFKNKINDCGWVQLLKNSSDYHYIRSLKNDFTGNNPHKGNLKYDNGYEYISYFTKLFKYAVENEEFNDKAYSSYSDYLDDLASINDIGFLDLKNGDNDYHIYQDKKLHYFCDYINQSGDIITYDDDDIISNAKNTYTLLDKTEYSARITTSGNLDQIMNIKRVDIKFKLKFNNTSFKAYLDKVILQYLTQIIPSSVILNIKYE